MSEAERVYVIDRLEGASAVLVPTAGPEVRVARRTLPAGAREGSVVRVRMSADGVPDWPRAARDEALERARREEGARTVAELRKRDPGGDVAL